MDLTDLENNYHIANSLIFYDFVQTDKIVIYYKAKNSGQYHRATVIIRSQPFEYFLPDFNKRYLGDLLSPSYELNGFYEELIK